MPYKILLSRPLPFPPLKFGDQPIETYAYQAGEEGHENAQIYCTTALDKVDAALIHELPKSIGLIASIGVGTNHIDLQAAKDRGILVSNTPVVTEDTADLAFTLILAACRQTSINERFVRNGLWSTTQPLAAIGQSVHGKTLGILGFGAIGQAVARRAKGFGMNILYHGPNLKISAEQSLGAKYELNLSVFLSKCDILSLHCPLTPQTHHILNDVRLKELKKGAVLVNTGRGNLIDEGALVNALNTGHLSAAGLDVFAEEPDIHPGLLALDNVILTPHMGSATHECRTQMVMCVIGNILNFLEHGKPINQV